MSKDRKAEKREELASIPYDVHVSDLNSEKFEFVVTSAGTALKAYSRGDLKHFWQVAEAVKKECDERFPGKWHVIVGKTYGAFVTQEAGSMCYFNIGDTIFLIWKHG